MRKRKFFGLLASALMLVAMVMPFNEAQATDCITCDPLPPDGRCDFYGTYCVYEYDNNYQDCTSQPWLIPECRMNF